MTIIVRCLLHNDKDSVMDIVRDTPEFELTEVPVAEEVLDAYLESPDEEYLALVAEIDGAVVGYICFGSIPLTLAAWDVYWLAVRRGQRGMGIGKALLTATEERIKQAGGYLVLIETSSKPNYTPTRRFYRKNGYHKASCIHDFYAPGDHRVTFAKSL